MWLLIIYSLLYCALFAGWIYLMKKNEVWTALVALVISLAVPIGVFIVDLTDNDEELCYLEQSIEKVEYLSATYDVDVDYNGETILEIKNRIDNINSTIKKHRKGIKHWYNKEFYSEEIANKSYVVFVLSKYMCK